MDQTVERTVDSTNENDHDHYDENHHKHYILRNLFDLTAHSILMSMRAGIENSYDESILMRYVIDAFKEQIDEISKLL